MTNFLKLAWMAACAAMTTLVPSEHSDAGQGAQYTRALGSMYFTSLVIVCVCTGR